MSKTIERKKVVKLISGGRITDVKVLEGGLAVEVTYCLTSEQAEKLESEKGTQEYIEKYFPVAKLSSLTLEDEFLKHKPETEDQYDFKEALLKAIESGLSDVRVQLMDPSFSEDEKICYKAGLMPAVGKPAEWWYAVAKKFLPEYDSRLGLTNERIAFLGLMIKERIEEGYTVSNAWKEICDENPALWHYGVLHSKFAREKFHPTGSHQVGKWFDLDNTVKITVSDEVADEFSLVGGGCDSLGESYPITLVDTDQFSHTAGPNTTGWLVLDVVDLD